MPGFRTSYRRAAACTRREDSIVSLLDDARRLASKKIGIKAPPPRSECAYCGIDYWYHQRHEPDCPWLSLPKIVAALEAAERATAVLEAKTHRFSEPLGIVVDALEDLHDALYGEEVVPSDPSLTGTTSST